MVFLKSLLAGLAAIAIYVVLLLLIVVGPQIAAMRSSGSGGIGAVSAGVGPIILLIPVVFAAGFWWQFRRASRSKRRI